MLASGQAVTSAPANLPAIRRQALAFMADIAPHGPVAGPPNKVSYTNGHAFWGTFFGDSRIAALVAVDLIHAEDHPPGDNADLCLPWWENGWKFRQWVGKISATADDAQGWDWAVKHREPTGAWYVVSRLGFYPAGEHLSWLCDPKTHTLIPTGWPRDSIPSIAGDTITFTHQEKPGYSQPVWEIYRFTDHLAEHIATRADNQADNRGAGDVLTLWDEHPDKVRTWQVRQMIYSTQYALCRTEGKQAKQPFREDAIAKFDWSDLGGPIYPIQFLWRRVSGLSDNALRGEWDQDGRTDAKPPSRVTVTGLSEAVQQFSWPLE